MPHRVIFTPEAKELVRRLKAEHGPLIFYLSGGCCEGSAPMCFRQSDFRVGARDVLLGVIEGCPFYAGPTQYEYWAFFELTVGATAGGDSFSIEAAEGVRFIVRSRLFSDAEAAELKAAGPPPAGPGAMRNLVGDQEGKDAGPYAPISRLSNRRTAS